MFYTKHKSVLILLTFLIHVQVIQNRNLNENPEHLLNPLDIIDLSETHKNNNSSNKVYEMDIKIDEHPVLKDVFTLIYFKLTRNSFYLRFSANLDVVSNRFIIQFRKNVASDNKSENLDCPSFGYWFRHDRYAKIPSDTESWSVPIACSNFTSRANPVWGLSGTWQRKVDTLVRVNNIKTWNFEGIRKFFSPDLTKFGFDEYKWVRIYIFDDKSEKVIDTPIEIK